MKADREVHITRHDVFRIVAVAGCDPRTVRRFIAGEPIRYLSRRRIEEALAGLGLELADDTDANPEEA